MRLFWALPWPDSKVLENAQRALQRHGVAGRWVRPELAHLTLVFLGEVDAGSLDEVREAGVGAALDQSPISLQTGNFGAFPRSSAARTLWWGLEENRELTALAHRLHLAMRPFANIEERPFQAHLTLARFRQPTKLPELPEPPAFAWAADHVILYRSHLGATVIHEPLAKVQCNG